VDTLDTTQTPRRHREATDTSEWEQARERLQERQDFGTHVVVFVVVNAALIAAWAITGSGYFWPAWILAAWGVGLVLHGWEAFLRRPITAADVDKELERQHRKSSHA
jgi:hypothetical protein